MMALATHQLQGCSSFPSVPSSLSRQRKLKHPLPAFYPVGRKDRLISLKCGLSSRSSQESKIDPISTMRTNGGASLVLRPKLKLFKVSAFKGGSQHDDSVGTANGSKSPKNSIKVSYLQHESEKSSVESSEVQNVVPAPNSAEDERTTRSLVVQNLFRNWLMLLRMPSRTQPVEEPLEESSVEISEKENIVQKQERSEFLKSAWCYFLGLDAMIKIPLLMFTPLYLTVNLVYGSEVSEELTPLWILGPLIMALYVKIFRAICGLYIFSFKQTVNIVKNLPSYCLLIHDYIFCGKLKEAMHKHIWQHLEDVKNTEYKEFRRRKLKDLQSWLVEKYLDFIESIWPCYCRTIRFLKRANLI